MTDSKKCALDYSMDKLDSNKFEEDDYYYSEQGYLVFTEKYLLKRGYCCMNGCKHCPYGYNKKTGRIEKNKPKDE